LLWHGAELGRKRSASERPWPSNVNGQVITTKWVQMRPKRHDSDILGSARISVAGEDLTQEYKRATLTSYPHPPRNLAKDSISNLPSLRVGG
ncbi:MAG: hypothetical protein AAGD07_23570, partial [Planctomycetota bacterium]